MRSILVATLLASVGCASAPRSHVAIAPASFSASPQLAAAVARAVIDARYGVDVHSSKDNAIVSKAEWLSGAEELARKWEHGIQVTGSPTTYFQAVAVVESPTPGQVDVRVIGLTSTGAERFEGLEGYLVSGDPMMPAWADLRVARLQAAINHVLKQYAAR